MEHNQQITGELLLDAGENPATYHKVIQFLDSTGVLFAQASHKPVKTSEEAAKERGVDVNSGAKALLVKYTHEGGDKFVLLVMSAGKKVNWKDVKAYLNTKNVVFASVEEVLSITGCVPGAVPPFGSVFGVKTLVDPSLEKQGDIINFNSGLRSHSITMTGKDFYIVEKPHVLDFATD